MKQNALYAEFLGSFHIRDTVIKKYCMFWIYVISV